MRTKSRRGLLGPLVLAALAGMILSESAQAQQTGLFPLAPIKRKRVPCNQEDPVYRIYKDQYFGYHPTLWRPFPSGWGAPSPEAPDRAASFKAIPLDEPPAYMRGDEEGGEPGDEPQDDRPPAQPNGDRRNPALPTPPPEDNRGPDRSHSAFGRGRRRSGRLAAAGDARSGPRPAVRGPGPRPRRCGPRGARPRQVRPAPQSARGRDGQPRLDGGPALRSPDRAPEPWGPVDRDQSDAAESRRTTLSTRQTTSWKSSLVEYSHPMM